MLDDDFLDATITRKVYGFNNGLTVSEREGCRYKFAVFGVARDFVFTGLIEIQPSEGR